MSSGCVVSWLFIGVAIYGRWGRTKSGHFLAIWPPTSRWRLRRISRLCRHCFSSTARCLNWMELPWLDNLSRPTKPKRLPTVRSQAEVEALFLAMSGTHALMARLCWPNYIDDREKFKRGGLGPVAGPGGSVRPTWLIPFANRDSGVLSGGCGVSTAASARKRPGSYPVRRRGARFPSSAPVSAPRSAR